MENLLLRSKIKELQNEVFLLKKENALLKNGSVPEINSQLATETDSDQFKFLCDHLHMPLVILSDIEGSGIAYCNNAWLENTGCSLQESNLLNPHCFIHPDHKEMISHRIQQRLGGDYKNYTYQIKIQTKNNDIKWAYFTSSVIKFNGKLRTMIIVKDISYEKEFNLGSLRARETFKTIFNDSLIIQLIIDVNSNKIVDVNKVAISFLMYSKEELLKKSIYDIIEDPSEASKTLHQIPDSPGVVKQVKFVTKNKEVRDAEVSISCIKIADESVYLFSLSDITQRKVIEKELIESEAKYKAIVDNNYDGIYIYKNNKVVFANERIYELSGYCAEEFASFNFWDIIHPDDKERIKKFANDRARGLTTINNYQGRVICKGGIVKECEFNVTAIKYSDDYAVLGVVKDISARVNAEREMKEKERFLSTLLSNLNGVVYRCKDDKSWTMLYLSDAIVSLSGYSKEDFLGNAKLSFTDIIHPDDREDIVNSVSETLSFSLEYRIISKDKTVKWVWEQGERIFNDTNECYFEGIISDISNFKIAQFTLLSSERKFKNLFNSIKNIVAIVGKDGKMLEFNPATSVLLKQDMEVLKGMSVRELGLINDEFSLEEIFEEISNSREVLLETKVDLVDLTSIELNIQISSVDYSGENCMLLVAQDVTERNRFQRSMEESAVLYMAIFGNTGTATCITDSTGEILLVNKKFKELCNCQGNNQEGEKNIFNFIPKLELRESKEKEQMKLIEVNQEEFVFIDKTGEKKTVVSTVKNIEGSENFVISLLDISKQKSIESDLTKLNEELENRVHERTKQLSIVNNYKSEFLANMSHEIRTPLNAILGFSQLLSNKIDNPVHKNYLQSILVSGKNLLSLVNDTLDLSKIEAGKLDISIEPISICSILENIQKIFRLRADAKGLDFIINIQNHFNKDNLLIHVDANRLKQVLVNLVGNAIKFTSQGFVKITMTLNRVEKQNCAEVIFQVEDSGIGIAKGFLDKVFEPFTQEERTLDDSKSGTGLGLSISKKLIELMDGQLNVESKVGEGSIFTVTLSEVAVDWSDENESASDLNKDNWDSISFKNATILIVDDVQLNREYLINVLNDLNVNVLEACNGLEALILLEEEKVDLVITDIKMPRKDGISLLQDMRNSERLKHIPVIAVTAITNRNKSQEKGNAAFSSYIFKPYSISDIVEQLIKFLPYSKSDRVKEKSVEMVDLSFKELAPVVIDHLKERIISTFQIIKERQAQSEVMQFGYDLIDAGVKYDEEILVSYGQEVVSSMEQFDITKLLEGFEWFGGLLEFNKISIQE